MLRRRPFKYDLISSEVELVLTFFQRHLGSTANACKNGLVTDGQLTAHPVKVRWACSRCGKQCATKPSVQVSLKIDPHEYSTNTAPSATSTTHVGGLATNVSLTERRVATASPRTDPAEIVKAEIYPARNTHRQCQARPP